MNRNLLLSFQEAFPGLFVERFSRGIPHLCTGFEQSPVAILQWLLDHQVTRISLDQPCDENIFPNLFAGFDEVWHSTDWIPVFRDWILAQHQAGNTYQTKVIKINNLRWLFNKKDLKILCKVFPYLTKLEFIGAEFEKTDDAQLEREFYREGTPTLSTKNVKKIIGDKAQPFSL